MPPPNRLTPAQLDELAFHIPHVKAWLKAAEATLQSAINKGVELKNVHLEPTQPRRQWTIGGKVLMDTLKKFSKLDVVAPRVPLSPAQAEKTLGKKLYGAKLAGFVTRISSGVKLVYSNDETEEDSE
jgi:hypothetical protein